MVTRTGAAQVAALLAEISQLEAAVALLTSQLTGGAAIWKLHFDVYVGQSSQSFDLQNSLATAGSAVILNAIKNVLQARLDNRNAILTAIT